MGAPAPRSGAVAGRAERVSPLAKAPVVVTTCPGPGPARDRSVVGVRPDPPAADLRPAPSPAVAGHRADRDTSEREPVNKAELVTAISKRSDVPGATVDAVLAGLQEELVEAITRGEKVAVSGLLTVERTQRSARTGRNPQTGESIDIPAANTVKVTAGSNLKKAASNVPV